MRGTENPWCSSAYESFRRDPCRARYRTQKTNLCIHRRSLFHRNLFLQEILKKGTVKSGSSLIGCSSHIYIVFVFHMWHAFKRTYIRLIFGLCVGFLGKVSRQALDGQFTNPDKKLSLFYFRFTIVLGAKNGGNPGC